MRKIDKHKPLLEMEPDEFDEAFRQIGEPLHRAMLDAARNKTNAQDFVIEVAVLSPSQRFVTFDLNHGDDEGARYIDEFIKDASLLLKPGESLKRVTMRITNA